MANIHSKTLAVASAIVHMKFIIFVFVFVLAASLNLGAPVPENSLRSTIPKDDPGMYYYGYNYYVLQ